MARACRARGKFSFARYARARKILERNYFARAQKFYLENENRLYIFGPQGELWVKEAPSSGEEMFPQTCTFFFVNKLHIETNKKRNVDIF